VSGVPQVAIDGRGRLCVVNGFPFRESLADLEGSRFWKATRHTPALWAFPATPGSAAAVLSVLAESGAQVSPTVLALAQEAAGREMRRAVAMDETLPLPKLPWDRWLKSSPWPHQKRGMVFLRDSSAAALGMNMGTGKSMTVVGGLNMLEVERALVVCPVATLGVFPRELRQHSAWEWHTENGQRRTAKGTIKKLSLVDRWELVTQLFDCQCGRPHLAVVGYEALVRDPVASADLRRLGVQVVVYDECLLAGTMIDTPTGRRPIESLRIGDQVIGVDHSTGELTITTVQHTFSSETSEPFCDVSGVPMTPNHPVWTTRGYIRADEVREDDVLCRVEGGDNGGTGYHLRMVHKGAAANDQTEQPIFSGNHRQVFNIETGTGNYVADGLLVHNCHRLKAAGGAMSLTAYSWVNQVPRRWALSGTLMPQSPDDIYGTYRAIDPAVFGTNKADFRARFILMGQSRDGREYPRDVKRHERLEFSRRFHSIAYCPVVDLKLPRSTHTIRSFDLEPAARQVYEQIRDQGLAEITAAVVAAGGNPTPEGDERTVAPANAGVEYLRFAQITGGTVTDDAGNPSRVSTAKVDALDELLHEVGCRKGGFDGKHRPEPVIVFCRFIPDLDAIKELCAKRGLRYGEVSGRRKDGIDDDAKMNPECDVVAAQIASGSQGIDFTRSRINVWYSVGFELWLFQQAQKRSDRPGQTRSVANFYLVANNTIDGDIYRALAQRANVIESVHGAYLRHIAEGPTEDLPTMETEGEVAGQPVQLPDWLVGGPHDPPRDVPDREAEEQAAQLALIGLDGF
jgi:Hint domain